MKNILEAKFMVDTVRTLTNLYRLGWDERNGGNLSFLLYDEDIEGYLNTDEVIREIPMSFDASAIKGKIFLVTGTGKYFKNVQYDPAENLGIIRISDKGNTAELLWGFSDGGRFTSELPAHLMSHMVRLEIDPEHRVVMHTHPTNTIAMSLVHDISPRAFTRTLWQMQTESIVALAFDGLLGVFSVSLACSCNISASDSVFIWCSLLVCLSSNSLRSFY